VVRTRVGYAGGAQAAPTYADLGDHSETIQIEYDPAQITYQELLDIFWRSHSPTSRSWSKQYASIIFYHNEEQKRQAEASMADEAASRGRPLFTEIAPLTDFYLAEGYHQKHSLQQEPDLLQEFLEIYPDEEHFAHSTAAMRVNSYLAGYGTLAELETEIDGLGLSQEAQRKLVAIVAAREP
jgi:methionine-S-sulfoxide reductase